MAAGLSNDDIAERLFVSPADRQDPRTGRWSNSARATRANWSSSPSPAAWSAAGEAAGRAPSAYRQRSTPRCLRPDDGAAAIPTILRTTGRQPAQGMRERSWTPCGASATLIEVKNLGKRYGDRVAVDDLTFTVRPGARHRLSGANGAGKSTTACGWSASTNRASGSVTVNGRRYGDHPAPLREIGVLLDARAGAPGRSALQPPALHRRHHRHPEAAGGRGDRSGRPARRRPQAGRRASPLVWDSGWGSPPPCSATRTR